MGRPQRKGIIAKAIFVEQAKFMVDYIMFVDNCQIHGTKVYFTFGANSLPQD